MNFFIKQVESFHGDNVNTIPSERLGLKLLDELLESSSKSSTAEKQQFIKSPSEKHFTPLEHVPSDRDLHPLSLPAGITNTQLLDPKHSEYNSRSQKPPIPAPRPSKTLVMMKSDVNFSDLHNSIIENEMDIINQNGIDPKTIDSNTRNLAKIDISEATLYNNNSRDYNHDNWLVEVGSYENSSQPDNSAIKLNGERQESRIYENIMEFQGQKRQNSSLHNGYGSHTLPKSGSSLTTAEMSNSRSGVNLMEKKFPAMGVSSTLSRKMNGHIPCDADILPALYASSKVKNGYQRDVPSELENKSPEFKKLWISRPEKLTFQDKIRKFSLQAGEDDIPRDRVKNSRAQREIEIKFNDGQRKTVSSPSGP